MSETITVATVNAGIPEEFRPFFRISSMPAKDAAIPFFEAFWFAIKIFAPKIQLVRPMQTIISTSPFEFELNHCSFTVTTNKSVINMVAENLVFLDVVKTMRYPGAIRVAVILEEFVHAYMNVTDEDLTKRIVTNFYDAVTLVDGCYAEA